MLKYSITLLILLVHLLLGGFSLPAHADRNRDPQLDHELWLKAAYLYNFTRFVKWPVTSTNSVDNLTFCVVENYYFTVILIKTVSTRTIVDKNIRVKNVSENDSLSDCDLLYIDQETPSLNSYYLKKIAGITSLTVGNADSFIELGGVVRFHMIMNRLKFEINDLRAVDAGLIIDTQLLKLGRVLD